MLVRCSKAFRLLSIFQSLHRIGKSYRLDTPLAWCLSGPFGLVVGCINNNWLNLWKKIRVRCSEAFCLLSIFQSVHRIRKNVPFRYPTCVMSPLHNGDGHPCSCLSDLRQDPLGAILVIFGRRALIFFAWKILEKYEKWHHFCAHAHWWSPWRRKKCRKRAPRSVELNFFINCNRQKQFSQNERRRADLQNFASNF